MKKRLLAVLLICAILIPAFPTISAHAISPRLTYISEITPALSVSGTTATFSLKVAGSASVTSISATLQLQKLNGSTWSDYGDSWNASATSATLRTNGTKPVTSGSTYRLKVVATAYTPSGSGSATAYSA